MKTPNHVQAKLWRHACLLAVVIVVLYGYRPMAIAQVQIREPVQPILETRLPGNGRIERLVDGTLVSPRLVKLPGTNLFYRAIFIAPQENPLHWTDIGLRGVLPPQGAVLSTCVGGDRDQVYFIYQDDRLVSRGTDEHGRPQIYSLPLGSDDFVMSDRDQIAISRALVNGLRAGAIGSPFGDRGVLLRGDPFSTSRGSGRPHFASQRIGAVPVNEGVHLTVDAGVTWNLAYALPQRDGLRHDVSGLLWVDDTHLLVAGKGGGVLELLARDGGALRRAWTANLPLYSPGRMTPDGEGHVWIDGDDQLVRVDLATGQVDALIEPRVGIRGMAIVHGRVLLWGSSMDPAAPAGLNPGLGIWTRTTDEKLYTESHTVLLRQLLIPHESYEVSGALELAAPECLVIMKSGEALRLDVETGQIGRAVGLSVARAPWPEIADFEHRATVLDLGMRLPPGRAQAILDEAAAIADLTPLEQVEWAIEQMKEEVAALGPEARTPPWEDPDKPTVTQILALAELSNKWRAAGLSMEEWEATLRQAPALEFTPREAIQWQIDQLRQALDNLPTTRTR